MRDSRQPSKLSGSHLASTNAEEALVIGMGERVYESTKLAALFDALVNQGCPVGEMLRNVNLQRALEHEMLYALVHCLMAEEAEDNRRKRQRRFAVMAQFEELLGEHIDRKLDMARLCADLNVAERTLRMYCHEFLGVSPTRYITRYQN